MFSVTNRHEDNLCFGAAAARNPERVFKQPDFFPGFDGEHDRINRMDKIISEKNLAL